MTSYGLGQVYFIAVGGYVKVGYSYRPEQRIKTCLAKVMLPDDLDRDAPRALLATIEDCKMLDERRMHARLADHHAVGEWFRDSDAFRVAMIDALANYETVEQERRRLRRERRATSPQSAAPPLASLPLEASPRAGAA